MALFRFIVEFFREPDAPFIGPVSMGMALSLPMWRPAARAGLLAAPLSADAASAA